MQQIGWLRAFGLALLVWIGGMVAGYALVDWASGLPTADLIDALAEMPAAAQSAESEGGSISEGGTTADAHSEPAKTGWDLFLFIWSRNVSVYVWLLMGLLSAGAITFVVLLMNGITLGQTIASAVWSGVPASAVGELLLPHGVLEIGAFCIAGAVGFQGLRFALGRLQVSREGIRPLRLGVVAAFGVCALAVAAGVEAFVTIEFVDAIRADIAAGNG